MTDWQRVSKRKPCPICKKPDWCLVSPDGDAVICPRIADGADKFLPESGYLHKLGGDVLRRPIEPRRKPEPKRPTIDAAALSREFEQAIEDKTEGLAAELGVSPESLERLNVGWSMTRQAFTFPMRDATERIIGIRLRYLDGQKKAVTGSRAGLFIPQRLTSRGDLWICEGPTDTCAMLTLSFDAIGRPSCTGGTDYIKAYLTQHRRHVTVIADNDGPGEDGARRLVAQLADVAKSVRLTYAPGSFKDIRARVKEATSGFSCDSGFPTAGQKPTAKTGSMNQARVAGASLRGDVESRAGEFSAMN